MGGSIGSGSSNTSGYSITAPPKYVSNAYQSIIKQAQNTAATPYTPYSGQMTAGLTNAQNQAISGLGQAQGAYQPYYDQASTYGQQATTAVTPMEFSADALSQFQNPYTNDVVNATLGDLARLFGQQQSQVTGNAIASGAWGGDRAGIVKSNLANNQAQTAASTLAGLRQSAYTNAVQQFNTANQAQMSAQQQNNANALSAAQLYQNLGTGASTNAINLNQALMGAGTTQQATDQAALDAQYQQFLNQQQYPFQTLSWLTGVATGVGSNAGGTTIGNSTTNTSGWNVGANITSDERAKEDIEPVGQLFDGQPIYRYHYVGDDTPRIGLIAQEVEQSHPEAVDFGSGLGSVHYGRATEDAAGLGRLAGYASGGDVMPYAHSRGMDLGSLPVTRGGGPPRGNIPQGEARIPSIPSGGEGQSQQSGSGDRLQQGLSAIKDKIAPLPGASPSVAPSAPPVTGASAAGVSSGVGDGLSALGKMFGFAEGGAVETDDDGVPLIFGPPPVRDDGAIPAGDGVDPLPGRPVAGLGAISAPPAPTSAFPAPQAPPAPQAGVGRSVPRGIRTNNPGNIKDSEFARTQPGYVGSDGVNAIFESPDAGYAALNKLLDVYGNKHGLNTVSGILNRWAPSSADNNDTSGYIGYVSKRLGVDPNSPLTPEARAALPSAMAYFENGREFPTSGSPLAATGPSGRVQMAGRPPQAGLGYADDEASLPPNAEAAGARNPPPGIPSPGLQNVGAVDDGKAFGAAIQAGLYGLLTTGNIGQAIQAGTQTYTDLQYRMRGQLSPNEKMQVLQQQMYQSQADKLAADVDSQRVKTQMEAQGTWAVVGPVNDADGNVIGTAVINNRTGEVVTRPIGVTKKPGPEHDVDARKRAAAKAGLDPGSPAYQTFILTGKMPREDQAPLTATDKKAILEADEGVMAAQTAIDNLKKAKDLSPAAYAGPMAGQRGYVGSLVGLDGASETVDLDNLVKTNALSQLKSIFGAAPTEGERAILLEIQGSSSLGDKERQKIYDRAIQLAERRLELNKQRADELRGGSFYKPKKEADPLSEAKSAIAKGAPRDAVIQRLKERGIDTTGL